jgi:pilus assembly protein CpaB
MKTRATAMLLAVLLAIGATGALFLYVRGVRTNARTGGKMVTVIVTKQDIPTGTSLDSLVSEGAFTTMAIPRTALVRGAVTSLLQMRGKETSSPVVAGEQMSTARFSGSNEVTGGGLGIPQGFEAITVPLDSAQSVGGMINRGDRVTVYASINNSAVALVPDALVLRADNPENKDSSSSGSGNVQITMALSPTQALRLVLAQKSGSVWLALLPPNEHGIALPPLTSDEVAP